MEFREVCGRDTGGCGRDAGGTLEGCGRDVGGIHWKREDFGSSNNARNIWEICVGVKQDGKGRDNGAMRKKKVR